MAQGTDFNEVLRQYRLEMVEDYYKYRSAFKKRKMAPPGALTGLAAAMAMGDATARPGDAKQLLDAWDESVSDFHEAAAGLMASYMLSHKLLYWLNQRGFLHTHRDRVSRQE